AGVRPLRVAACRITLAPPIRKGAGIGWMVQDGPDGRIRRRFPKEWSGEWPDRVAAWQENLGAVEVVEPLTATPQSGALRKDERHDVADLVIRVFDHPPIGQPDQARRPRLTIGSALDVASAPGVQPQPQPVELCFGQSALE